MAEIVIDVSARLKVLQSSIAEVQKVLNQLQPNTSQYKAVSQLLDQMQKQMRSFQAEAGKGFTSEKQFKAAESSLDKMETALEKIRAEINSVDFKDLKLDSSLVKQLDEIQAKIQEIKTAARGDFLKSEGVADTLKIIDPKLLDADLNTIETRINAAMDSVTSKIEEAKEKMSSLGDVANRLKALKELEKMTSGADFTNVWKNGKAGAFQDFFKLNKDGSLGFNGNAESVKQQIIKQLKDMFQLTAAEQEELKLAIETSAGKGAEGFMDGIITSITGKSTSIFSGARKRLIKESTESKALDEEIKALEAKVERYREVKERLEEAKKTMSDDSPEIRKLSAEMEEAKKAMVDMIPSGYGAKIESAKGAISGLRSEVEGLSASFLKAESAKNTLNSIKMAITNFMGARQIFRMITDGIRDALDHIKQLDSAMNGIAIVSNLSTSDLWKQIDAYSEMAQRFGTTIQGAYDVSKIYYQAGYDTQQVLTLTNETLKFAAISGVNYADSTDYMMTALRGFKMEVEDASRVVDVYSNLAANTAVSQEELAVAMSKTASSMESVGATFEESSAMIATMVAVTRESATNIGTALKSIAARYGELTKNPDKIINIDGEEASFNKVDTALQSIGITLKDEEGQFRSITEVIRELADVWDQLSSVQQRYVATSFAGNRLLLAVA